MTKIVASAGNSKVECFDYGYYRENTACGSTKITINVYKKSSRKNKGEWRKIHTFILPRGIIKKIGLKMQEIDNKLRGVGETCLLEYD